MANCDTTGRLHAENEYIIVFCAVAATADGSSNAATFSILKVKICAVRFA